MDGNGRWAQGQSLIRVIGHEAGAESVRDISEACVEWGIGSLTLYAFSEENWKRPKGEVTALMKLLTRFLVAERPTLAKNGVRLLGMGRLDRLPPSVLETLRETERLTASGDRLTLRLALSYGGRAELVDAIRAIATRVASGELAPSAVDEAQVAADLYHPDMPEPDLVIRTAGEQRLSNFLLWQASYAEFHFTDVLWPDFRREHLLEALLDYAGRVRKFGGLKTGEQGR